jgi:hypothetical protein
MLGRVKVDAHVNIDVLGKWVGVVLWPWSPKFTRLLSKELSDIVARTPEVLFIFS